MRRFIYSALVVAFAAGMFLSSAEAGQSHYGRMSFFHHDSPSHHHTGR